jgi:hypothetical protein
MDCLKCRDLEQAFASSLSEYSEARFAAFYRVSTELAAKKNVDMERAKTDLQEHQSACPGTAKVRPLGQVRPSSEVVEGGKKSWLS